MADSITLRVITPEEIVLDTTAEKLQVTGVDGLLGILPRHAPMIAALGPGPMTYVSAGGSHLMFVSTGFCEVHDNTVRIVSNAAEPAKDIDQGRARAAEARARKRLHGVRLEGDQGVDIDTVRAEYALRRALGRLQLIGKI